MSAPFTQSDRRRIFHGWKVTGAGAGVQALIAGLYIQGYGLYAVVLEEKFEWSKTLLSTGYSVGRAESSLIAPLQGWALDRYGPKQVMRAGLILVMIGFTIFSQVNSVWHLIVGVSFLSIGGAMAGFLSVMTATVRWFERRRAFALSLSSLGFAIGGALAPVVVFVIETAGWRWASFGSGVLLLLVGWPLTEVFAGGPVERGEFIDDIDPATVEHEARAEGVSDTHFTAGEAIRTRAFWLISFGHASALFVVGAVIAHLSLYLTEDQGFTLRQAGFVVGALPIFQAAGMVIGGKIGDRVNKRLIASIAMIGHSAGILLLAFATSNWMIWLFVPIHGLAWGFRGPLMQAIRADYFGSTAFGQILGISSLIVMLGTVGGPMLAGVLADVTGSYRVGFVIIAAIAAVGMMFFVFAAPPELPARQDSPDFTVSVDSEVRT